MYPAPSGQAGYSSGGNGAGAGGGGSGGGGDRGDDADDAGAGDRCSKLVLPTSMCCVSCPLLCPSASPCALPAVCSGKHKGGIWAGWEARCAADSQFAYKVAIEQVRVTCVAGTVVCIRPAALHCSDLDLCHLAAACLSLGHCWLLLIWLSLGQCLLLLFWQAHK